MNKRRVLKWACGLLVAVFALRLFYFQELFFAFLIFAGAYVILLMLVAVALCLWNLYARGMVYLAGRVSVQGHQALPLLRVLVLWLAPSITKSADALFVCQRMVFGPFQDLLQGWLRSFRLDAAQFRVDAERAVKQVRILLKQS